jgi:uncharacterized protein (DUF1499 family)
MNPQSGWNDPEPYAATALWARRLGFFSVAVALVSLVVQRSGRVEPEAGMAALGSAAVLAALAVLMAMVALLRVWFRGTRGAGAALAGITAACAVLAPPAVGFVLFRDLPALADITTDPANPLRFRAGGERKAGALPSSDAGARQLAAYPQIVPLQIGVPVEEAYALALELVEKRRWRVLDASQHNDAWRIEAVATAPVVRLAQDVVIEIRRDGGGSRVEMRSASRWGDRDFGTNARRIRDFFVDLTAAAGA